MKISWIFCFLYFQFIFNGIYYFHIRLALTWFKLKSHINPESRCAETKWYSVLQLFPLIMGVARIFFGRNTFSKNFSKNFQKFSKKIKNFSKICKKISKRFKIFLKNFQKIFKKFWKIFKNFLKKIAKNALF